MRNRTVSAVLAVLGALVVPGTVLAADDTVGGILSVTPRLVVVTSTASLTQDVRLTVDPPDGTTLTPDRFELAPGQTVRVEVAGPATGSVSAAFSAADRPGESVGIVLRAGFRPSATTTAIDWRGWGIGLGLILATVGAFVLWGARRGQPGALLRRRRAL